jgi:hypothetical protein
MAGVAAAGSAAAPRSAEQELIDRAFDIGLVSPFEAWCQATGTHPEAWGAWERYRAGTPQPA